MQKALKAFRTHWVQKVIDSIGGKMLMVWIKITFPFCNVDAVLWHSSGNFPLNLELSADLNNMPAVFVPTSFEVKVCFSLFQGQSQDKTIVHFNTKRKF